MMPRSVTRTNPSLPRPHRICVAGSRLLGLDAAEAITPFLMFFPGAIVLMRRPRGGSPARFEARVAKLCHHIGLKVEWWRPAPGGRSEVMYRDIDMAASADLVVGVFAPEAPMEGGTAHVIDKAVDRRVPAYGLVYEMGEFRRLGEYDPDHSWDRYFSWLAQ